MGEVYRARDARLSRDVAVKVLPALFSSDPDRLRRFEQEARAAGSLNHPNVLTVHDVGVEADTPYVVSELLEGETLRSRLQLGPPPLSKTIELVREICEGLAAAHDKGIVHRDLKPENVFLTRLGHAKILDFGLAKLRTPLAGDESTGAISAASTAEQTRAGVVLGTVGYMSPEQIRGESLDGRSDIFALGSVLHEMLSGQRSFRRPTSAETMHAILNEDPPPLDERLGPGLERIVRRCLEKRPEERFQSARDVAFALEAVSGGSASAPVPRTLWRSPQALALGAALLATSLAAFLALRLGSRQPPREPLTGGAERARSVAVLPFRLRGAATGHDHLGLALPDEIATLLTYAPGLAVRPFTDSSRYEAQALDLGRVGKELGVQHLVVGSFGADGEDLRISVEAVELASNRALWRDTWTVSPKDLKSLRDTVRERVSVGLLPALGLAGDLLAGARRRPASQESYELYLRASALAADTVPSREAMRLLERATTLDPDFAPAWYELAFRAYRHDVLGEGGRASHETAIRAVSRAVALDPDLLPAVAFKITLDASLGQVAEAYRSAAELARRRPGSAEAHHALSYALRYGGAQAEAARECRVARGLDPSNPSLWSCYWTFLALGDYEQAESFNAIAREHQPELHAAVLADIRTRSGERARAREAMALASDETTGADLQRACLQEPRPAGTAALVQRDVAKLATIRDPEALYWYGAVLADCGFEDAALRFLASSIEGGYCSFTALGVDTMWDRARERPAFHELREKARACQERFLAETGAPS
jgi:TolB-like protein